MQPLVPVSAVQVQQSARDVLGVALSPDDARQIAQLYQAQRDAQAAVIAAGSPLTLSEWFTQFK
jgi:hypothetical protein